MIEILKNGIVAEGLKQNLDKLETYVPTSGDIVIKKIFEAPIEKVWQAISDKDQMKMWYFDLPEFKAEIGCEFSFIGGSEGGIQYIHHCQVTELETNKKMAYTWKYEGYNGMSTVIWELEKIDNQTQLTLTHKNIESFPSNNPDLAKKNFVGGWDSIINSSLSKFLNS
ncbi:SRPBCC domain-containing protein [Lacihabitans sp. LS3-19]|nr:SRPBCC domain-containing protein [Lacihabitans sp. LS3-19]